jgi:hypothetical protein
MRIADGIARQTAVAIEAGSPGGGKPAAWSAPSRAPKRRSSAPMRGGGSSSPTVPSCAPSATGARRVVGRDAFEISGRIARARRAVSRRHCCGAAGVAKRSCNARMARQSRSC